jgi:hypothetical protein
MRFAFEEAEVDAGEVERLEPAMTNEAKDRHVLAAASPPIRNWSSPSTSTTSRPKLASRSASRRSTPTTSCSTFTTSPRKQSGLPSSSKPATFTRPGRSNNSSRRWLPPASPASSQPSAARRDVASVRPRERCRHRDHWFRAIPQTLPRGQVLGTGSGSAESSQAAWR